MVDTSDDRNGVVVNRAMGVHAIDSTRGAPKQLVEQRCIEFGNSCEKANCSLEISAKSEHCSGSITIRTVHYSRPKIRISTKLYSDGVPSTGAEDQFLRTYKSQPIGSTVNSQ